MPKKATITITLDRDPDEPLPDDGDDDGDDAPETGTVVVFVQDSNEKAIEHGEVTLRGGEIDETKPVPSTSAVSFTGVPIQGYEIIVTAQGYKSAERFIYESSFK